MAASGARILIVEDDPAIREGLELNLGLDGHATVAAADGNTAQQAMARQRFDLVLLDVMLPGRNGFELLRFLRQRDHDVPVVLLTARTDEADKVLGLELGADDYVTKPFGLAELRARVRAHLRRAGSNRHHASGTGFADVRVDRAGHRVHKGNIEIALTAKELAVLNYFLDHPERVLSRSTLLRDVWQMEHATLRTVDNFVMRLRNKLESDPNRPRHFITVRGAGYRFSPAGTDEPDTTAAPGDAADDSPLA
jgi:DNA-binding response OmpR family regulator